MSQKQLFRVPKVVFPDHEKQVEDRYDDDLMGQSLQEIDAELGLDSEREASRSLVQITGDEVDREDFFEEKPDKPEEFGEIQGMTEICNDDEEQGDQEQEEESVSAAPIEAAIEDVAEEKASPITIPEVEKEDVTPPQPQIEAHTSELSGTESEQIGSYKSLVPDTVASDSSEQGTVKEIKKNDRIELDFTVSGDSRISGVSLRPSPTTSIEGDRRAGRKSIFYDMERRIQSADQDDLSQFLNVSKTDEFFLLDDHAESVEEESVTTIVEEEVSSLDREFLYEKYADLNKQLTKNRVRSNVLQKLVIMYLKRRKVENIYKDCEPPLDQTIKYGQKLDAYQHLLEINETQRLKTAAEVSQVRAKRVAMDKELNETFNAMQNRESVIGHGLIYSKTGNQIADKLVDRFIKRQSNQIQQVSTMRLKFIKLKGMVQEKLDAINKLDNLENDLHLANYEQLKSDNRSYADKIEERDEELTRLRTKCQNTIQILAHMREKSAALDADLNDLRDDFDAADSMARDYRENLADIKHTRDRYRMLARNLKEESGLLTKTDLLKDMKEAITEVSTLEVELTKCQDEVKTKKDDVRKLRKNLEELTEEMNRRRFERQRRGTTLKADSKRKIKAEWGSDVPKERKIYKRRPTLYLPIVQQAAFKDLVKIRPMPSVSNRRK